MPNLIHYETGCAYFGEVATVSSALYTALQRKLFR
jgi:hypothetical protein